MTVRRCLGALTIVSVMMTLVACSADSSGSSTPSPGATGLRHALMAADVEVVADDLEVSWSVAFHEGVVLVSERESARILELGDDGQTREVGMIDGVEARGEGGLLGIAVHDDHVYAYLTAADENRIDRYPLTDDGDELVLGRAYEVMSNLDAAGNHNGGRIAFGPDGMLYATVGDAGDPASAQDFDSLSGKVLRLTPDGDVPEDKPFEGSPVYTYGHRNPQGITWDEEGALYVSEFGQDARDELNVIEAGGNYGWPEVEGIAEQEGFVDPV